jgi:U3 small nucleolar RNA-associated protein 21
VLDSGRYGSGEDVVKVSMPSLSSSQFAEDDNSAQDVTLISPESQPTAWEVDELPHKPQIMPELVTLSLLPKSQWQSLVKLDIIKMRNKPIEPPKKPEKAPFFLPTLPSLSGDVTFTGLTETAKDKKGKVKPLVVSRDGGEETPFLSLLRACSESGDCKCKYFWL